MDSKNEINIFEQAIKTYGEEAQVKMVLEEVTELQKEISNYGVGETIYKQLLRKWLMWE